MTEASSWDRPGVDRRVTDLTFDEVYGSTFDAVWRALRRFGVPEASVEDAAQDVFVVVHRRLDQFEGRSTVRTWVLGIAVRVARDYRRSMHRKGGLEELPESLADGSRGPYDDAVRSQAARILDGILERLDEDKREVFVLAEIEQLTAPEIAQALDANLNTIYSRLRAARQSFELAVGRHRAKESRRAT